MVKFKVKKFGEMFYMKKELREVLSKDDRERDEIFAIANAKAVVLFPKNEDLRDILASLEIIREDIKHRINLSNNQDSKR